MRCAALGLGLGATKEHSLQRSVTEEQQRPRPNAAQPTGRPSFFALTALLAPYRPLRGMLVARALSARKIPGRACVDNSVSQYQPIINDHRRAICQSTGFAFGFIAGTALWIGVAQGRLEHRPVGLHFFALPQVPNRAFLGTCSSWRIWTLTLHKMLVRFFRS